MSLPRFVIVHADGQVEGPFDDIKGGGGNIITRVEKCEHCGGGSGRKRYYRAHFAENERTIDAVKAMTRASIHDRSEINAGTLVYVECTEAEAKK